MMAATALVQEPRADAGRRARQLAGLAQGEGAAARRRLRRPRAGRRGPGRGRRARARPLRRADRAHRRGRADARGRQARLADPARAAADRLDRAGRDQGSRSSRPRAARSSTRSTSRPAATRLDVVVPLAIAHGAALIALTIDEVGMAKTAERKVEIAQRITELACDEHGLDREALIFDVADLHAHHRRRGVEAVGGRDDRGHPPRSRRRSRASRPRSASRTCRFGVCPPAPAPCSTRSSCTTASRPGSTWRWSTRTTSRPTARSPTRSATLADDLVFNRREDALERFIDHFEGKGAEDEDAGRRRPDRGHGARGGAALPHPAPQEGRRRGLDRPLRSRRSARSRRSTTCCCRR